MNAEPLPRRRQRDAEQLFAPTASPWTPATVAPVLAALQARPITTGEVRDRAVSLGLLRLAETDGRTAFTSRAVSRLCLIGYRLPAQAERASLAILRQHLEAHRSVFVVLAITEEPRAFHVRELGNDTVGTDCLLRAAPDRPGHIDMRLPLEQFATAWTATACRLIVALRSWPELTQEGPTFFGGMRDIDGAFHWNSAACDTDAEGNLLRF